LSAAAFAQHTHCTEHFKLDSLFEFFSRPIVADAVSFDMCPLPSSADVPKEIARVLPDAPCPCPPLSEESPTLSVSQALMLGPSFAKRFSKPAMEGNARVPGPLAARLNRMLPIAEWAHC
jgi:hypothetical protein